MPDLAAHGASVLIVKGGNSYLVDGTSASALIVAAIVALLNNRRLAKGRKSLGFLSRLIYERPGIWNDVTVGNNPSCGTNWFSVKSEWDTATGIGTPNFQK